MSTHDPTTATVFEPGSALLANAGHGSEDPTGTATKREREAQHYNARWRRVRGILRETVERNDALRLRDTDHGHEFTPAPGALRPQAVEDFGTESDSERLARFRQWFRAVLDTHVLEPTDEERVRQGSHYSSSAIRTGYARGLAVANTDLRRSSLPNPDTGESGTENPSDLIGRDRHQEALATLFVAIYGDIERAANETHTQVTRTLSDALDGVVLGDDTVKTLTTQLTGRVDAVGQTRTEVTANTRIVQSVNKALIERAAGAGVERMGAAVELSATGPHEGLPPGVEPEDVEPDEEPRESWRTAEDDRVCPQCQALSGQTWRVSDVRAGRTPIPPIHGRCRCRLVLLA